MKLLPTITTVFAVVVFAAVPAHADIIPFNISGVGGPGLLTTNELHGPSGNGSGGEVGAGISYDDVSMLLTVNIGWGSGMGFTDLTGDATAGHLHGPANINETAGIQIFLSGEPGFDDSATNGGFTGTVAVSAAQETMLFDGDLYINIHTAANGAGEIRGNLFAVPEPASAGLLGGLVAFGGLLIRRRRR